MKRFNVTGPCIATKHYKVDISEKMNKIYKMIDYGQYFCINRPRQYGKTTTLATILFDLENSEEYLPVFVSFEGFGDCSFLDEKSFGKDFLSCFTERCSVTPNELTEFIMSQTEKVNNFRSLSSIISNIVKKANKKIVLMIDEVDSAGNHDVFIKFLAMLREKYISADLGREVTFHCVILCKAVAQSHPKKIFASGITM